MRLLPVFALSALLAGCGASDMASMPIQDSAHSLTLVREKSYFWSEGWNLAMVVTRMPDCMRRHHLKHAGDGPFEMEVFDAGGGGWILRQGKRWYVADTAQCDLQQFQEKPPEPGNLVGAFEDSGDGLRFVPLATAAKSPPPAAEAK